MGKSRRRFFEKEEEDARIERAAEESARRAVRRATKAFAESERDRTPPQKRG